MYIRPTNIYKLQKETACMVTLLMVAVVCPALAGDCNNIFLVKPPEQLAGSIYLNSESSKRPDGHISHPRQGYLPVGTLLVEEQSNASDLLPNYAGFIAANGTQGLVHREHIKRLDELLVEGGGVIKCNEIDRIVIPVSPLHDVQVYHKPRNKDDEPKLAFKFSRSAFRLVVISGELKAEQFGRRLDASFYQVKYAENTGSSEAPKWRLNNGLLKRADKLDPLLEDLNGTYRFTKLDKNSFNPLKPVQKNSWEAFVDFIGFKDYKLDNPPTMKDCNREELMRFTHSKAVGVNIPLFLKATMNTTVDNITTIRFPSDEKYIVKSFRGVQVDPKQEVKILKVIKCSGSTMHYAKKMRIFLKNSNIVSAQEEAGIVFDQKEVMDVLGDAFITPRVSGLIEKQRDRMFVVRANQNDIFTPFARLEQFLTKHTYSVGKPQEQRRLIALVLAEMALWE